MQTTEQEVFTDEQKMKVGELVELVSDAFSRVYIPMIAFDSEKVKYDLSRSKEILGELV